MDRVQSVEELQGLCSRPSGADAKPSFTRASILFVCVFRGLDRNKSRAGQRRAVIEASHDVTCPWEAHPTGCEANLSKSRQRRGCSLKQSYASVRQ